MHVMRKMMNVFLIAGYEQCIYACSIFVFAVGPDVARSLREGEGGQEVFNRFNLFYFPYNFVYKEQLLITG